jgi:hypothetical protein
MKYKKCSKDGYCKWLLERSVPYRRAVKKGIAVMELYDIEKNEMAGCYVGYKAHAKDKFLTFNFCPFCGFDFIELHGKGERVKFYR